MPTFSRLLVAIDSHDPKALRTALGLANQLCSTSEGVKDVVLLVESRDQLEQAELASVVGTAQTKTLSSGEPLELSSGGNLRVATSDGMADFPAQTVLIVHGADTQILEKVEGYANLAAVIAVPRTAESVLDWEERHTPSVYGASRPSA